MTDLFGDLKILDFTNEMGAYCTKLFADLGAEVIKIEPLEGDSLRSMGPFYQDMVSDETSLYHFFMNTNKKSITLDIEKSTGQEIIKKLVQEFDIIVENFPPGYLDSLGIGYTHLKKINPKIIFTSITGFGQDGPYSQYKASDLVGVAMGGLMYLAGYPDTPPVRPYGNQGYYAVSLYGAVGTILAIYNRDINGFGQHVDVSMQESIALALENSAQFYDLEGTIRKRVGAKGSQAGWGLYPCADGEIYLMAAGLSGQRSWKNLVNWLKTNGLQNWEVLTEKKWMDLEFRLSETGKGEFTRIFTEYTFTKTKLELYEEGQKNKIAICPVNDPKDLLENPQLKERKFFVELFHEDLQDDVVYPGAPYRLSETPWSLKVPAPAKGKHTLETLMKLGFSKQEINSFKEGGVI
jgi:benzylsuccinate CoA-transferase BbsE subunit